MERYIGLDVHAASCTLAVEGPSGKHLRLDVVETNGKALIEYIKLIPGRLHLCMEEGTQSAWLYEVLSPHVDDLVVLNGQKSKGQKNDKIDAFGLAERVRLKDYEVPVYKEVGKFGELRELCFAHRKVVADHVRVQNRIKALFRSRGIDTKGDRLFGQKEREDNVKKLPTKMRSAAQILLEEYDMLLQLRKKSQEHLEEEANRHEIIKILKTAPGMGPIRVAHLMSVVISPYRFRTKKQLCSYAGLGVVMRSSSDWVKGPHGKWMRVETQQTRGLTRQYNAVLKWVFKGAATTVITGLPKDPLHENYQKMLEGGTKPNLAKLTLARKIAALVLSMWKNKKEYDPTKVRSQDP